jgi:hypothetical protein
MKETRPVTGLSRMRRERPSDCRATEQRDELASPLDHLVGAGKQLRRHGEAERRSISAAISVLAWFGGGGGTSLSQGSLDGPICFGKSNRHVVRLDGRGSVLRAACLTFRKEHIWSHGQSLENHRI